VGHSLLAGREFDEHDTAMGRRYCLISQPREKALSDENPIGQNVARFEFERALRDCRHRGRCSLDPLREAPGMEYYIPWGAGKFSVRERHGAEQSESRRRHAARAVRAFES